MDVAEFRDHRIQDLSEKELNISVSRIRTHAIEAATVYYYNNVEYSSDRDALIADASRTFNVPIETLRFTLRL